MTLIDYPGHLWSVLAVLLTVGWMIWAFRANSLVRLGYRRWGLAVLACLPVLLSLWFLANPGRLALKTTTRPCTVLALFDTSESMSVVQDQTTRLDQAIDQFQKTFQPDSPSSPAFQYYGFDRRCVSAASLKQLTRWGRRSNLMEAWSLISPWLVPPTQEEPGDISGIVIFTDGQVDQTEVAAYAYHENPDMPVVLVGVGSDQVGPDVAMTQLQAPTQVGVHQAYPVTLTVETTAPGQQGVTVDLFLNDHLVETCAVIPQADSRTATVACTLSGGAPGTDMLRAHARMADREANLRNNDRYHVVQIVANDKLKVLLYSEVACRDIGKVRQALLRDEKVDLEFRLNAVRNPAALKGDARQSHLVQLPDNAEDLNRYDVIVLGPTDVDSLPPQTAEDLYHYVATRGGALILLPGKDHMAVPNWKNPKLKSLLPVTFSGQVSDRRFDVMPARLTDQAQADVILGHLTQASLMPETLVAYEEAIKKPAASTWVNCGQTPLICMHRFGRGRVCLLNCPVLSQWYSETEQGGALREWLSSVTSRIGGVRTDASRIDVVTRHVPQDQTIHVEALVRDLDYRSADDAMVLLTVNEKTHRMQSVGPGRYQVTLEGQTQSSFPIRVKAEQHGRFLGERVTTVNLPTRRGEMMRPQANRDFLRQLAGYVGADYVDLEQCNAETAKRFAATRVVEESSDLIPLWRRWSLLMLVCGSLILYWFLRRTAGLV